MLKIEVKEIGSKKVKNDNVLALTMDKESKIAIKILAAKAGKTMNKFCKEIIFNEISKTCGRVKNEKK